MQADVHPSLEAVNILIYAATKDSSREVTLPLSMALEEITGLETLEEARKHLRFLKSDCRSLAQDMQKKINYTLYLHTNHSVQFEF